MKTLKKKSNLFKAGAVLALIGVGYFSMPNVEAASESKITIADLQLISDANASPEGSISCSGSGSGCKFTVNGEPYTSTTHKE